MKIIYDYTYTDTFHGEANYSWVKRGEVEMPELTAYGYDGSSATYRKANRTFRRELVRAVKAEIGLTGLRCKVTEIGDAYEIVPCGMHRIAMVSFRDRPFKDVTKKTAGDLP